MGTVEVEIERIAKSRVRDALLHLTRDSAQILDAATIANEAAVEEHVVVQVMASLQHSGPFQVTPAPATDRTWVVE